MTTTIQDYIMFDYIAELSYLQSMNNLNMETKQQNK